MVKNLTQNGLHLDDKIQLSYLHFNLLNTLKKIRNYD